MFNLSALLALPLAFTGGNDPLDDQGNWAQWRGPDGTGISSETNWVSEGKSENLWSAEVGLGYSSVVIGDGKLYTMGYDAEAELDIVFCLDAKTGEEIWTMAYGAKIWNEAHEGGTVNTPTLDGDRLFTLNREGNLFCLDAKTGEELWHRALKEKHELTYPRWGFSGSPLVAGENLILNVGKVLSVNKKTGKTNWISAEYGDAYCTPLQVKHADKPMVAIFNATHVAVLDQVSGQELYTYELPPANRSVNAAAPIQVEDALFVSSGRIGGSMLLAFGDGALEEVWSSKKMKSSWAASILINEHLYGFDNGSLKCLNLEGEEVWKQRGLATGAIAAAGERLILLNDRGELVIAEAKPDAYHELSRAQVFGKSDGKQWSIPVIADGLIYCRASNGNLVCRDHRATE